MIHGTGIDIIEIDRIKKAIDRWGDNFLRHVFNEEEIAYAQSNKNPVQHYAARFAAKEAVFKAFGDKPDIRWKDIKVMNDSYGRPCCIFKDNTLKYKILISLSHTQNYAVANAIITTEK